MLNVAFADDLSIQITREIKFANGFGQIEAKPILKNISKDIKVMGDYNVDEKSGNVVMKIDKVLYGGKIYDLSESFSTKRRLKNVKTAVLKNKAKIKLSGGSHPELLAIFNDENTSGKKADGKNGSGSNSTASNSTNSTSSGSDSGSSSYYSRGYGSSSGSSQYPYYGYGSGSSSSGSSSDKSSPTTDSNGNCKSPEIRDGMAYVYPLINGVCTQKAIAESNVYKKQNTSTCPNKTDYENMAVSIGEEQYAIIDDTEYRVKSCYYTDTIALSATTENCSVIPDYDNKQGAVQKQYWYILNNERVNIGSCVPTGEVIAIYDDDYNACQYRFDFENGKAIKQTKWYYLYENKKKHLGECVDVSAEKLPKMTYPMYENAQGCECNEVSGVKLCQTKLSFNGMGNTKEDATECRYIDTEGVKLIDEFVGNYSFKDDSRQAVKKINQYFIGEGGERVYVTKDKETNKSYPYKEMSCGWEHIDDKKLSYHKTKFIIKDPELLTLSADILANNPKIQGDEYEIKGCEAVVQSVLYWQMQLDLVKGKKTDEHTRQVLVPEELSPTATRWSLPMIKTKNSSGVQIEAMLEEGEIPSNDEHKQNNFTATNYPLYNEEREGGWSKRYCDQSNPTGYCGNKARPIWNLYPNKLKINGGGVDNLPESITIGWAWQNTLLHKGYSPFIPNDSRIFWENERYQTAYSNFKPLGKNICLNGSSPFTKRVCTNSNSMGIGLCAGYGDIYFNQTCQLWGNRYLGINNPITAQSNLSQAYSITLDTPIIIKPTKIDIDEHITADSSAEDAFFYKTITQKIPDPTGADECLRYPNEEFMRDESGEKICELKKEQQICKSWDNAKCKSYKTELVEDRDKCEKENQWKKYADWTFSDPYTKEKAGTCKTRKVNLYTTGVTFTPNYDDSPIDMSKQYCKAGETQSFEAMNEKQYETPDVDVDSDDEEKTPFQTDSDGNPIIMADGESTYYKYIQSIKDKATNIDNYSKEITKVLCTADYENSNLYAYIVGAVVNHYHPFFQKDGLRKLEVESLTGISMNLSQTHRTEWRKQCKSCKYTLRKRNDFNRETLNVNFRTKENWYNNQRIYEHEMYRPFRRPDGTTFYLYERQGFFINPQSVDCADCARDDELNG